MILQNYSAAYTGKPFENGGMGFFANEHYFFVFSVEEGMTQVEVTEVLHTIEKQLAKLDDPRLIQFENKISEFILQLNLPSGSSISAGYIKDQVIYIKTVGKGIVMMRRDTQLAKLINGDNSASGYMLPGDLLIFTTANFNGLLGDVQDIQTFVGEKNSQEIVDQMTEEDYEQTDQGIISLFVTFETVEQSEILSTPEVAPEVAELPEDELDKHIRSDYQSNKDNSAFLPKKSQLNLNGVKNPWPKLKNSFFSAKTQKSQKLTMIVVALIFVLLTWSVVFGYQRRAAAQLTKQVDITTEVVAKKLLEAEEMAFLDMDQAMANLAQAKSEVVKLKKIVGNKKADDIASLEKIIQQKEAELTKKEEKEYEEFYDLALEDKEATGEKMYLDGTSVAILDSQKSRVYILSLDNKSIQKKTASELKAARLVALNKDKIYVFGGNGVYQFTSDTKVKSVLEYDSEWGDIQELFLFNGNLYLLDSGKDEIYKYVATDQGFGKKSSYIQSGATLDLEKATSLAIDSSVYVANGGSILKFTRGAKEEFSPKLPVSGVKLTKIFTDQNIEKVLALDKSKSTMFVLNKTGSYERQFKADILGKANDFFATKTHVYVLVGQKIYRIGL